MSPFRSEKQRRFMYSQHPEIAERWTDKYGSKIVPKKKKVPQRTPKTATIKYAKQKK